MADNAVWISTKYTFTFQLDDKQ